VHCPTNAQLSVYLTVNIQYSVQFVHFIISVKQNAQLSVYSNCQYTVHCAVCIFYYICPKNAQLSVYSVNIQYTVQFVHFIISVQKMHNYLFTLSVYSTQSRLYIFFITDQKMLIYLFTLSINSTMCSLYNYYIGPTNAQLSVYSNCQYTVHCAVCTFYYICPTNAELSVQSNCQYTVHCSVCTFIISVQPMQNYLLTLSIYSKLCSLYILLYLHNKFTIICSLTVNIEYTVQFVHFIISVQQMHNYLFTLSI